MPAEEYRCYGCNSTFVIWDEDKPAEQTVITCPRCKSAKVERYYFPPDACRLCNLAESELKPQ
ncbi:MAG: hypothetical protein FJZ95_09735 [Chloroflexi bacterium]|nr:hypothetical protein [Chloroflexota bacterium]